MTVASIIVLLNCGVSLDKLYFGCHLSGIGRHFTWRVVTGILQLLRFSFPLELTSMKEMM